MSFDTLVNFRDLGDYKVQDGRQIVAKKLLRSGELYALSAHDINLLVNEYHLSEIIDFRSEKETSSRPDDAIENAIYNNIDMFKGDSEDAPALEEIEKENANRTADERMFFAYEHLIVSPVSQKGFRKFFDILLNNKNGASLWHCFAGKDRTGIAGALVLYLLGASKETIHEDYLRTNASRKAANDALLADMKAKGASEKQLADTETMMYVKIEYLDYAVQVINERFGSIDAYITDVLGISDAERTAFQEMYLV
jgi:Protein tyrosine/serine phosphatase